MVSGNIGAGKTSLIRLLAPREGWQPHYEFVKNNPYLSLFYRDMKRWVFHLEMFFLWNRVHEYMKMINSSSINLADRAIYEGRHVFVENLYRTRIMTRVDYQTYNRFYEQMLSFLRPPDLVVYLRVSPGIAYHRVKKRRRRSEAEIPLAYFRQLHRYYERYMEKIATLSRVLTIDTDNLNPLVRPDHLVHIADQVYTHLDLPMPLRFQAGTDSPRHGESSTGGT